MVKKEIGWSAWYVLEKAAWYVLEIRRKGSIDSVLPTSQIGL